MNAIASAMAPNDSAVKTIIATMDICSIRFTCLPIGLSIWLKVSRLKLTQRACQGLFKSPMSRVNHLCMINPKGSEG